MYVYIVKCNKMKLKKMKFTITYFIGNQLHILKIHNLDWREGLVVQHYCSKQRL